MRSLAWLARKTARITRRLRIWTNKLSGKLLRFEIKCYEYATHSESLPRLRMSVCQTCPFFTKARTCRKCGCFMPVKTKLKNARCPLGKW